MIGLVCIETGSFWTGRNSLGQQISALYYFFSNCDNIIRYHRDISYKIIPFYLAFRCNTNAQQNLSKEAKFLLCLPSWKRKEDDLKLLNKAIENLTLFKKFQPVVKKELAKSLHYECFEDGRIIIQQGML